jgi:hypothetical protein
MIASLVCASCDSPRAAEPEKVPADAQAICTTTYDPFAGLSLTRSFSYLAIRADRSLPFDADVPDAGEPDSTLFESGTPCQDASDRKACEARLASLHAHGQMNTTASNVYLVGMIHDDVVVYETIPEVAKLLGTIDTPGEVALLGILQGWSIDCAKSRVWRSGSGEANSGDSGWTLYAHAVVDGTACWRPYSFITFAPSGVILRSDSTQVC